jgi:RNA polymerase sigma factor (sigma-70 family)
MRHVNNPLAPPVSESSDEELATRAASGDRQALERLLVSHQPWVFNIAMRMLWRRADAEDATQDILIKVLKGLRAYRGESAFRTWLYRIAVNHIVDMRQQDWQVSTPRRSFDERTRMLAGVPDADWPDPRTVPVPFEILVEEAKIGCTMGVLLCLDGRQRLVFILAEILGATDEIGAEIVGVTPANFRQILSRTRRDLYQYLNGSCSLVNPSCECKCTRKARGFLAKGYLDPERLLFTPERRQRVREVVRSRADELTEAYETFGAGVFRDHPFYGCSNASEMLRKVLATLSPDLVTLG